MKPMILDVKKMCGFRLLMESLMSVWSLCVLTSCGQSLSHLFFSSASECWPGLVMFPDFTQSKVRTWWAKLVKEFVGNDIDGIWNDMNELAVFKVT